MKKGTTYAFSKIQDFSNENDYNLIEIGSFNVGKNFITLQHNEKDLVLSFVLTGATSKGAIFECVYSDI